MNHKGMNLFLNICSHTPEFLPVLNTCHLLINGEKYFFNSAIIKKCLQIFTQIHLNFSFNLHARIHLYLILMYRSDMRIQWSPNSIIINGSMIHCISLLALYPYKSHNLSSNTEFRKRQQDRHTYIILHTI